MNAYSKIGFALALTSLVSGCSSPVVKHLEQSGGWKTGAIRMVAERSSDPRGVVFEVFPDLKDPLHVEIWKALRKQHKIGDGYGTICRYYGWHLVTISEFFDHGRSSFFYNPTNKRIVAGNENSAFNFYRGDRSATGDNIRHFITNLLAARSYPTFLVDNHEQIPHSQFKQRNPGVAFDEFLAAKGIAIRPVGFLSIDERSELGGYSECSVFAYQPCGGMILRYDVICQNGRIVSCKSYELVSGAGDCWFIM